MTAFVVAAHYLRETFRHKFVIVFGVVQPALYLVFFGPVFTASGSVTGTCWCPVC